MRESICRERLALGVCLRLRFKLCKPVCACAGYRLIGGGHNRFDGRDAGDGGKRHQRDNGRAIRVGNDPLFVRVSIFRVDFRHHERHIRIKAESAGIVHKHCACSLNGGCKTFCDIVFRRAEHDVHALERSVARLLYDDLAALVAHSLPGAARARKQAKLPDGEFALCKHLDHFPANGACCAQHGHVVKLFLFHSG